MADKTESTPGVPELRARLEEVANTLRQSDALKPASQAALAELIEELSKTLNTQAVAPAEVTHLAESTAHLAEALHQRRDSGFLARARESLERAVTNAEARAPLTVGLARRLLETLANVGI